MDPENGEDGLENLEPNQGTEVVDAPDDEEDVLLDLDEGEGDEEEPTDEPAGQGDESQPTGQQPSRRTVRVQKLEKERDDARKRELELQARLDSILSGQGRAESEAAQRAEQERIAKMDPIEREAYQKDKAIKDLQAQVRNLGFAQEDGLDKARFEAKAEMNPVYKKYAAEVEKTLLEMRAKGVNTTREALLTYKLGEAARKRLEAGASQGRTRAAAATSRVRSVQGRPANLRGDSGTGKRGDSLEERLKGVQI
jgi:hypothetical protein